MHRRAFLRLLAVAAAGLALAPALSARPSNRPKLEEWVKRAGENHGRVRVIVGTELLEHLRRCNQGCAVKHFGDARSVVDTVSLSFLPQAVFVSDARPFRLDDAYRPVMFTELVGGACGVSRAWLSSLYEVVTCTGLEDGSYTVIAVNRLTFDVVKEWSAP